MEAILAVRLGAMGDVIHALAAVAALRDAFPEARIGWAIDERWAELLSSPNALLCAPGALLSNSEAGPDAPRSAAKPLVDVVHPLDAAAWRAAPLSDETWGETVGALRGLRAARYEAAIDFQGLMKSALVAKASSAPVRLGFADPKESAAKLFYTRAVERTGTHVVEMNLALAQALTGREAAPARFELPRDPGAEAWCDAELRRRGAERFLLLVPGGGWGAKLWPAARYGEAARALAADGLRTLVNYGPGPSEAALAQEVVAASGGAAQPLSCSVSELIALTRRAQVFLGGDTGPMHLAAALGVPVVAVFGPTDPARNGPFGTRSVVLRSAASQTSYAHGAQVDPGMLEITTEEVVAAARRLAREHD
ncbi:MAG: glycosyltransferase family 9 protein [Acidobacteriota bacterium]|nr:glycosyltransferase family 9 protein [Acidobacteriota bacterium]